MCIPRRDKAKGAHYSHTMELFSVIRCVMLVAVTLSQVRWSYSTSDTNKLSHALIGNRNTSYNIVSWNCGRALLGNADTDSQKFIDIKLFIQEKCPHLLAVIEADLHGENTTAPNRRTTFSTEEIREKLQIDGYSSFRPPGLLTPKPELSCTSVIKSGRRRYC